MKSRQATVFLIVNTEKEKREASFKHFIDEIITDKRKLDSK